MALQFAWSGRGGNGLKFARSLRRAPAVCFCAVLPVLLLGPAPARAADQPKHSYLSDEKGDSPVEAYDLGFVRLQIGDLKGAEASFRKSLELGRKLGIDFAPPHEGLARVYLKMDKLMEADVEARFATELDPTWVRGWWARAKVAEREGNDELALSWYERGLLTDPVNEELGASAVDLLRKMGRDRTADELEARQRKLRTGTRAVSGAQAAPGTAGGAGAGGAPGGAESPTAEAAARRRLDPFFAHGDTELTPELLAVFSQPILTRGAMAVMVCGSGEGSLARGLDRSIGPIEGAHREPVDVTGRPEAPWINRAMALDVMEAFPDRTFRPDEPVTRLVLALWVEETIARLRRTQKVFGLYRGTESPFTDLPNSHYGYNAARIVQDLELLAPRDGNRFAPDEPVGLDEGSEALRRLVPALAGQSPE